MLVDEATTQDGLVRILAGTGGAWLYRPGEPPERLDIDDAKARILRARLGGQ